MKFIVFIRSHNDFDHVLPILDYLIRERSKIVEVYGVTNDYKTCSQHITYLKNELSTEIVNFADTVLNRVEKKILNRHKKIVASLSKCSQHLKFICKIINIHFARAVHFMVSRSVKKFIANLSDDDIVMIDSGSESMFPHKYILYFANIRGIPTVSYAHGCDIFTNKDPIRIKKSRAPKIIKYLFKFLFRQYYVDYCKKYIVGPGQIFAMTNSVSLHVNFKAYSRLVEIGIPRFSSEWIERFSGKNHMTYQSDKSNNKVNVVLFLSNSKFNVNISILSEVIESLSSNTKIDFKNAPHTRSGLTGVTNKEHDCITSLSSVEVIQWADVGIVYGSSIAYHMLIEDVTILVPRFIDNNTNVFGDNNVAVVVDTLSEMLFFLENYSFRDRVVNKDNIDHFINKSIYGGFVSYQKMMESFFYHITHTS